MPIERGQDWGRRVEVGADIPVAADDRQAARLVGDGSALIRLAAGDLARTLGTGSKPNRPATDEGPNLTSATVATAVAVDAIEVRLDDGPAQLAVAHVVIGRPRPVPRAAVMNAAFVGTANLAPRAHPGDSRLDVVEFNLGVVDALKAYRRLSTGTHLPHPRIGARRVEGWAVRFDRPTAVRVDGALLSRFRKVECHIVEAAFEVVL